MSCISNSFSKRLSPFLIKTLALSGLWTLFAAPFEPCQANNEQAALETTTEAEQPQGKVSIDYFGNFFGPSLGEWSSFQPSLEQRGPDSSLPILLRNHLSMNLGIAPDWLLGVTGSWTWQMVQGQYFGIRDPLVKLAKSNLLRSENRNKQWSWYTDLRVHLPVAASSRRAGLIAGIQSFHSIVYQPPSTSLWKRISLGSYFSGRYNARTPEGIGDEWEIYWGPYLSYHASTSLEFTVLYESGMNRTFASLNEEAPKSAWYYTGSNLQPGLSWSPTPNLTLNPYINILSDLPLAWKSTAFGMSLHWQLLN